MIFGMMKDKKTISAAHMKRKTKHIWVKKRHAAVFGFLRFAMAGFVRLKYRYRAVKAPLKRGPCIILHNHQTNMDPFFVSKAFSFPVYFVALDDIFNCKAAPLIRYLAAPIPKTKGLSDLAAVKNILRVLKEGGTVGISPEGNCTVGGRLWENIPDAVAKLIKTAKVPVVLFTLRGGYGTFPRWGASVRRGTKYTGQAERVLWPEDYKDMSVEELYRLICRTLDVTDADTGERYKSPRRAEYIERALYLCPVCGHIGTIRSEKTHFFCTHCNASAEYTEQLTIEPPVGGFRKIYEWYDWERGALPARLEAGAVLSDGDIGFFESVPNKRKVPLDGHAVSMDKDAITVTGDGTHVFPLAEVGAVTAVGKKKLNFYFGGKILQIKGNPRFCAVKYVHAFEAWQAAHAHQIRS